MVELRARETTNLDIRLEPRRDDPHHGAIAKTTRRYAVEVTFEGSTAKREHRTEARNGAFEDWIAKQFDCPVQMRQESSTSDRIILRATRLGHTTIEWGGLEKEIATRCNLTEQEARALAAKSWGLATGEIEQDEQGERYIWHITSPDRNERTRVYGINPTVQQENVEITWPGGEWQQTVDWLKDAETVCTQITRIVQGASRCIVQHSEGDQGMHIALLPIQRITVYTPDGEREIEARWGASGEEICQVAQTALPLSPHDPIGPETTSVRTVLPSSSCNMRRSIQ
jgi:hypothetical protein